MGAHPWPLHLHGPILLFFGVAGGGGGLGLGGGGGGRDRNICIYIYISIYMCLYNIHVQWGKKGVVWAFLVLRALSGLV